jgi:hypothetical protein
VTHLVNPNMKDNNKMIKTFTAILLCLFAFACARNVRVRLCIFVFDVAIA